MDELQPWDMFTNNMEESEGNMSVLEERKSSRTNSEGDMPSIVEVETKSKGRGIGSGSIPNFESEENDDNAIFDFGFEPQGSGNDITCTPQNSNSIEEYINYENAVVYICPACGEEFDSQDIWKRHMNTMHNYNTRHGLNFMQLDKLYHECLECHKRIAMHAMENLLKHKFTHLPYRCTKCKICLRQYKYRQDLMIHLRSIHREDLIRKTNISNINSEKSSSTTGRNTRLEIRDVKENAFDIFENTNEGIEIKNEHVELEEHNTNSISESNKSLLLSSFFNEALSQSTPHTLEDDEPGAAKCNRDYSKTKFIRYICPQCGVDYKTQDQWQQHIEGVHDFGTYKGLNFKMFNANQRAKCLECHKVLHVNNIRVLQMHKFKHLPNKSWMRCEMCFRYFSSQKDIAKHLENQHSINSTFFRNDDSQDIDDDIFGFQDKSSEKSEKQSLEDRDIYEPNIDYLCPQCGKDFSSKKLWRKHIVKAHHLTDLKVLRFKVINDRQVKCLDCGKIITNAYGVQNAQQHRITHMPYKAFIRCRLCAKSYTDRKGLVKHLRSVHCIGDHSNEGIRLSFEFNHRQHKLQSLPSLQPKPILKELFSQRPKEIVKLADVTYEIEYLNDSDDNTITDDTAVPELTFNSNVASSSHIKCNDCGLIYESKRELQIHMKEEHEFLDFKNLKPLTEDQHSSKSIRPFSKINFMNSSDNSNLTTISNEQLDETDDLLLVPTRDEEPTYSEVQSVSSIEQNFCYLCPACGLEFKSQVEWRRHINEIHSFDKRHFLNFRPVDKFRYQCKQCKEIVSSSKLKGLQDHKFRHLPYKLYIKCLLCSTCYNHKPNIISHLRIRHNIFNMRSNLGTDQQYNSQSRKQKISGLMPALNTPKGIENIISTHSTRPPGLKTVEDCISFHNAVDHETITYFCPQCNENFDTHVFWRKHIVEEHNLNSRQGLNFRQIDVHHYLCLQCYKRVTVTHTKGAIGQLQSHKFRHLPFKSFKCVKCKGEFVRKQMFFKHLNRATNTCDNNAYEQNIINEDATIDHAILKNKPDDDDNGKDIKNEYRQSQKQQKEYCENDEISLNKNLYILLCPQCGKKFESWRNWREHINITHDLDKRENLNFSKVGQTLYQCLSCKEHLCGNKLRDLQLHRFKHLPHSTFLKCRLCDASYQHIRNIKSHLLQKHKDILNKKEFDLEGSSDADTNSDENYQVFNKSNEMIGDKTQLDGYCLSIDDKRDADEIDHSEVKDTKRIEMSESDE